MKSALEIVAFSNATKIQGILALIEVTQRALDEEGQYLAAVFLEHARDAYLDQVTKNSNLENSYLRQIAKLRC